MKKIIAIVAAVLVAGSLAFSFTSCKGGEKKAADKEEAALESLIPADQAVALTESMIKAAKDDDLDSFIKVVNDLKKLEDELSEEENEAVGKKIQEMSEEDQMALFGFMMKHMDELEDLDL